jgi:sodium transport system permease protein
MRGIGLVFLKEFFENLRDRRTILAALVFGPVLGPILLAALLQISVSRGEASLEQPMTLAVVGAERAPNLMALLESRLIEVIPVQLDEQSAREAVLERRYAAVLRVPPEFADRLRQAQPAPIQLFADASDRFGGYEEAARVRSVLERYASELGQTRLIVRGMDPLVLAPIVVQTVDVSTPSSRAALMLGILSYLVIFAMLMGGMYLAIDSTAGERERGSLEALLTLPLPRAHLIYGKILATSAYMLLAVTLTITACTLTLQFIRLEEFGMSVALGPLAALGMILLVSPLILLGASLMTVVASFTRSFREAQSYLGFVISVPTLPLAFVGVMGLTPSTPLYAVPSLSQHFLLMEVLRGELPSGFHFAISALVSLILGAVLAWWAGRLYEREAILG